MDKKYKSENIVNTILLVISIGILGYFCISNNNLSILINIFPKLNYFWLIIAIIFMFLSWFFDSLVINGIFSDINNKKYSNFFAFKLTMVGQYFSSITPLGVGGQPMQIVYLTRQGISIGNAISILVRKFLIYQSTMAIYSLLVIITKFHMFSSRIPCFIPLSLIGFFSQCFIVSLLLLFYINKNFTIKIISFFSNLFFRLKIIKNPEKTRENIEKQLNSFVENNNSMRKNKKLTIRLYIFTILQFTILFSVPFFVYKAFNCPNFPIINIISAQAFVNMISSYTPLPGAAGTSEGSFLALFKDFFACDILPPAMILCRLITYYLNIIVGFIVIKINKNQIY